MTRTVPTSNRTRARALAAGLLASAILTVIAIPSQAATTSSAPAVVESSPAGPAVTRTVASGLGVLTRSALASSLLAEFGATGGRYGTYSVASNGCTTLTKWYVGAHTTLAYGNGNGGDVATKLVQANPGRGLSITHAPVAGAIFSTRESAWGATQYCGATKCGHTGLVVGVNGSQVEILETYSSLSKTKPYYATSRTITWNAGQQVDFVYVGGPAGGGASAPVVPEATARAYVTKVYFDLLGRTPDAQGLDSWARALMNGTPYADVANGITGSDEYRGRLIDASYRQYLGREADAAGREGWLQTMRTGSRIEDVQASFVASDEFYAQAGGTDAGWVARLYTTVLGRSASTAEINGWVAQLGGAGRLGVARGFLLSTEHLNAVVDGYYLALLDRHADPTGLATWVQKIQSGTRDEQIIAGIVSSPEYVNNP